MNKGIIIVGAVAVGGLLLASSGKVARKTGDEKVSGLPQTKRLSYRSLKPGEETQNLRIGPAEVLVDGKPIMGQVVGNVEQKKTVARELQAVWSLRRHALPADANPLNTDKYSKELYWVPDWTRNNPDMITNETLVHGGNGVPVDEFGRGKPGNYGSGDNSLWGQTLGGLLKNPLFKTVAIAALVASGPEGWAAYGAYTMWENRGKDITVTNLALTAGRSYAVAQCGPPCGVAFDFGVGLASGKSADKSAESALVKEMTPEQRAYFGEGKKVCRKVS